VCKESALEIKGSIVPIMWLEQSCFNIRKRVCENHLSLLKTQETQMKLLGDKIYVAVLGNNERDRQYTRVKLMSAFNHKNFPQRKDVKLVSEPTVNPDDEEQKVENQVCLVEPSEFQDFNAMQILNVSQGVITYGHHTDIHQIVNLVRGQKGTPNQVRDFDKKTIFVVSHEDFERLQGIGQKQTKQESSDEPKKFDDVFVESLVQFGNFRKIVANRTK
jgi:hypothetical protein